MNSKVYWNKKIIEWENSIREDGSVSLIEKLGAYFRKPLKFRALACLDILKPYLKDKVVLDLGCGSGFFDFDLYEKAAPKQIIGIDISGSAIRRAQNIAKDRGLADKVTFLEKDATKVPLPKADITIGLGFLDYLNPKEIRSLFKGIESDYFLFTFSERKFSLLRIFHLFYLFSQKCPKHFYYTKKEIGDFINGKYKDVQFVNDKRLTFGCILHKLPEP